MLLRQTKRNRRRSTRRTEDELDRDVCGDTWIISGHICGSGMSGSTGGTHKEKTSDADMRIAVTVAGGVPVYRKLSFHTPAALRPEG